MRNVELTPENVLRFIRDRGRRPLSFRELAGGMGLSRAETRAFKRILRDLVRKGTVFRTKRGLYGPSEELNLVTGLFQAHRDGYGFVTPETPGEQDLFIPPPGTLGAMGGDRVVARVERRGRREGRIVRILEQGRTRVVGRFESDSSAAFVVPHDHRVGIDLYVPPVERGAARHGDRVLAEIIGRSGSAGRPPQARIVRVVGEPSDPAQEISLIIDARGLPARFPKEVREVAATVPASVPAGGRRGRRNLRALPTVTIDGERARDFDDAVSIAPMEGGSTRLWVHIADVGEYVPWDSVLDLEARSRGTSVYFPDRVVPMLPPELSTGICSLNPEQDRLAITVEMDFHRDGRMLESRFYPSTIRSDRRMTYTEVHTMLQEANEAEPSSFPHPPPVDLGLMRDLCLRLRGRRLERGSLDFDLPEPEIVLDLEGNPEAILTAERTVAHQIIEEFMIAANESVAGFLQGRGVPTLFRVHEDPDEEKINEIRGLARAVGVRWPRGRSLHNALAAVLRSLEGNPAGPLVNHLILRAMKQARYSHEHAGHFGLASPCYTHFTSPIRRYPDLAVHRVLKEVLAGDGDGGRSAWLNEALPEIAATSSRLEREAESAEREAVETMRVWFMRSRIGEMFDGRVVRVGARGLWVRLNDVFVEGFVPLSKLADDYYRFDEKAYRLTGRHTGARFAVGSPVRVRVDKADMEERTTLFSVPGAGKHP